MAKVGFEDLDTWKVCESLGGHPRALDASCEIKTIRGSKVRFRIIDLHSGSKLFEVWSEGSGIAKFDIKPDMECELNESSMVCISKESINRYLEIRKSLNEIKINLSGPIVSYYDIVR